MAVNTSNTILKYATTKTGTYAKLVDIVNYADMGASPSKLDSTTLTAVKFKTSILGLQEIPDLTFECNYDKSILTTINSLAGQKLWFHLEFDGGTDGTFEWSGEVSAFANGGAPDEVRKMTVTISAETEITMS